MTDVKAHIPIPLALENERLRGVIYGDPGCLAGDTHIRFQVRVGDRIRNSLGGSLERLYQRFNHIEVPGKGFYQREVTKDARFFVPSITDDGKVVQNEVLKVLDAGSKFLYELSTASGNVIRGSGDHEFLTPSGLVNLFDLSPGDAILANPKVKSVGRQSRMTRPRWLVKYHPSQRWKTVEGKYRYCRVVVARAIIEAATNMMTPEEYRDALNTWEPEKIDLLWTVPADSDVHHIDENPLNNDLHNLLIVSPHEHYKVHQNEVHERIAYYVEEDTVFDIKAVGDEQAYDLVCAEPYRNFVANDLVTHNTGKSTLAATFPKPLVVDTDAGLISVALQGRVLEQFEPTGYKDLENLYIYVKQNSERYETIIIDSFTELQRMLLDEIVDDGATRDEAKGKLNSITRFVPEQGEYLANQRQLRRVLDSFRRLDKHIILTAGVRMRGMQRTPDCAPGALSIISYWSSFIGEIVTHAEDANAPLKRFIVWEPTDQRLAKSRFSGFGRFMELPPVDPESPGYTGKTGYDVLLEGLKKSYRDVPNGAFDVEHVPNTKANERKEEG